MRGILEKALIGTSLAIAIPVIVPIVKRALPPLVISSKRCANKVVKHAKITAIKAKHEWEDIVYEARLERLVKEKKRHVYPWESK